MCLTIETFNPLFFILLGLSILLCAFLIYRFGDAPRLQKRRLIIIIYTVAAILLVAYKPALAWDPEYIAALAEAGLPRECFWDELPLEICNVNIFIMVIAALKDSKTLYSFVFYFASIGALFALIMPCTGFSGYSILTLRVGVFYITHFLLLITTPLIAGLNLFRPQYRDIPPAFIMLAVLSAMAIGVNFLLRGLGLTDICNYFYTMNPCGNPVLEIFYALIPIPGLYVLPCFGIALIWMLLLTFVSGALFRTLLGRRNRAA